MAKHYSRNLNEGYLRTLANEIIRRDRLNTSATKIRFMERWELLEFIAIHGHDEMPDVLNPIFILNGTSPEILAMIIAGEIDIVDCAKRALANHSFSKDKK